MPLKGADGFLQISIRLLICLPLPFLFLEKAMIYDRFTLLKRAAVCYDMVCLVGLDREVVVEAIFVRFEIRLYGALPGIEIRR